MKCGLSTDRLKDFVAMHLFLSWFAFSKMDISAAEMLKEVGELV